MVVISLIMCHSLHYRLFTKIVYVIGMFIETPANEINSMNVT